VRRDGLGLSLRGQRAAALDDFDECVRSEKHTLVTAGVETKAANFGGRGPSTPVMTPSLGAIFGDAVAKLGLAPDDRAETPCLTSDNLKRTDRGVTDAFPYLGSPI
jgi:hypothetical protein